MPGIDASIPLQVRPPAPINPLADVAQIMQLKQAQALIPLKIQEAQQQQQESAIRLQQMQRAVADQQAQDAAWKGAITVDDAGKPTIDRNKLTQLLPGHLVPLANETLDKLDKSREDLNKIKLENQKMTAEHGGGVGKFLTDSQYAPGAYRAIIPIEVANGITTPQIAQQLLAQLDQADQADPTGAASKALVKQHADQLLAMAGPAFTTAQARATTANVQQQKLPGELAIQAAQVPKMQAEAVIAQQKATGTEPISPYQQEQQKFEQKHLDLELKRALESARHNAADEAETRKYHALSVEGVQLTDEAKQKMAEMFAQTGQLPNLGMGKAAAQNRSDIINRAARDFGNVDFATNKAAYQANTSSLKALQTQADRVDAFENTAGKNIDLFLSTAGKVIDTGSPLLNAPARMLSEKVMGSQSMAAYKAARETALTEVAKVLESPGGSQALTVAGRDAVKVLSDPNATLGQQVASMKALKQDMANRKQSNVDQIKAITERIGAQNPNNPAPAAPKATKRYNPATGKIEDIP